MASDLVNSFMDSDRATKSKNPKGPFRPKAFFYLFIIVSFADGGRRLQADGGTEICWGAD